MWIAFIFQYLWDTTQPESFERIEVPCCELLSFFSIFEIQHNPDILQHLPEKVVNCFHFSVSLRYNTTSSLTAFFLMVLWIAFIFQYLWDTTQQMTERIKVKNSCELLSFFSIFEIQHNYLEGEKTKEVVVNCFHFSVSLRYNTTFWNR